MRTPGCRFQFSVNVVDRWGRGADPFGDRRMVMDDGASHRLTLKKGRHILSGSIINGPGMSDFCVRFIDEEGNPVLDYEILNK